MFPHWQFKFLYVFPPQFTQETVEGDPLSALNPRAFISGDVQSFSIATNAEVTPPKKKIIFLTDWAGAIGGGHLQVLRSLLFSHFKIYTKNAHFEEERGQEAYREVTLDNLYECIDQMGITDRLDLEVQRFCENKQLSADDVYLADYFGLERPLFEQKNTFQKFDYSFLNLSFFLSLSSEEQTRLSSECLMKRCVILTGSVKQKIDEEMMQQIEAWPVIGFYSLSGADTLIKRLFIDRDRTLEVADLISIKEATVKKLMSEVNRAASQILILRTKETDISLQELSHFPQLKSLHIALNPTEGSPSVFVFDNLEELSIESPVTGEMTIDMSQLRSFSCHEISVSNLEKLNLGAPHVESLAIHSIQGKFPDGCLFHFQNLRKFQCKEISGDHLVHALKGMQNLEQLSVSNINGELPKESLIDLSNLYWLSIQDASVENLICLLRATPKIELLKMGSIHGKWPEACLLTLQKLHLLISTDISTEIFVNLLCIAPYLEKLQIIKEQSGAWPVNLSPKLEHLRDFGCQSISPENLERISMCAPHLERLRILGAHGGTWQGRNFQFRELRVFECHTISSSNLEKLFEAAKVLQSLTIQHQIMGQINALLREKVAKVKHCALVFLSENPSVLAARAVLYNSQLASSAVLENMAVRFNDHSSSVNAFDPREHSRIYHKKQDAFSLRSLSRSFLRLMFYGIAIENGDVFFRSYSPQWRVLQYLDAPLVPSHSDIEERIPLRAGNWTILPTNSAGDELIWAECKNHKDVKVPYKLQYDQFLHLYRIQSSEDAQCDFTLRRSENALLIEEKIQQRENQSKELLSLIQAFNEASLYQDFVDVVKKKRFSDKLSLIEELMAYITYLPNDKPIQQKETSFDTLKLVLRDGGACRQRAWLFCAIAHALEVDCRYVSSRGHAFVEWRSFPDEQYRTCSLGGGGVIEVLIQKNSTPKDEFRKFEAGVKKREALKKNPFIKARLQEPTPLVFQTEKEVSEYLSDASNKTLFVSDYLKGDIIFLQNYCRINGVECFYIDSPETLKTAWRQTFHVQNGEVEPCSGELRAFLEDQSVHKKMLIIDWDAFSEEERVAYESVYHDKPNLYGQPISSSLFVIGFMSRNTYRRTSASFYSFVPNVHAVAFKAELEMPPVLSNNEIVEIPLYGEEEFDELKYQLELSGQGTVLKKGLIASKFPKESEQTVRIKLINPPKTEAFQRFYNDLVQRRKFYVNGTYEHIPDSVTITCEDRSYDFGVLLQNKSIAWQSLEEMKGEAKDLFLLNPYTFHAFFSSLEVETMSDEETETLKGSVLIGEGILDKYRDSTLVIRVTQTLKEGQWAQLLERIKNQQVVFQIAPSVRLPQGLQCKLNASNSDASVIRNIPSLDEWMQSSTHLLLTDDSQETARQLQKALGGYSETDPDQNRVITLSSGVGAADVLLRARFLEKNDQGLRPIDIQISELLQLLRRGKTVIARTDGAISSDLFGKLEPLLCEQPYLWVNGKRETFSGHLYFVTMNAEYVKALPYTVFQYESKKQSTLSEVQQPQEATASIELTEEYVETFKEQLRRHRCLFLEGPTGCGKSYFVQHVLTKYSKDFVIYSGIRCIETWLEKGGALFIDEANIQDEALLSIFKGMQDVPSGILIRGKHYLLTDQHYLVFAGNPQTYQGRRDSSFLKQYAHTLSIRAMSDQKMQEIFYQCFKQVGIPFGKVFFDEITAVYRKHGLVYTARDLLAIGKKLQAIASMKPNSVIDGLDVKCACYLEIRGKISSRETIGVDVQERLGILSKRIFPKDRYYVTKKGFKKFVFVDEYSEALMNLYFGLEGRQTETIRSLLLEGPSGIGKSSLIKYFLKNQGFVDCTKGKGDKQVRAKANRKAFYQITADLTGEEVEHAIHQAFQNGAIVVVENINLLLSVEKNLNAYLQGEDEDGNPPQNSGFWVIASQNPSSQVPGRQSLSPAMLNRFTEVKLADVTTVKSLRAVANCSGRTFGLDKEVKQYREAKRDGHLVGVDLTLRDWLRRCAQRASALRALYYLRPSTFCFMHRSENTMRL